MSAGIRNGSQGTVRVSSGGHLTVGEGLVLGSGHESTGATSGSLHVTGTGSRVDASFVCVGATGAGEATVRSGGVLHAQHEVRVGTSLGNEAILRVAQGGQIEANRLVVGPFYATAVEAVAEISGGTTTATIADELLVSDVGHGRLTLSQGAALTCARATLGITAASHAVLNVESDATLGVETTAYLGYRGDATLDINGGTVDVGDALRTGIDGGRGDVLVRGGGALFAEGVGIGESGNGSDGTLTVTGVNSLVDMLGVLSLGNTGGQASPPRGAVHVSSGGRVVSGDAFNVGWQSRGELTVSSGGVVESQFARIGRIAGSSGLATITGSASRWTSHTTLFVGGHTASGPGGDGALFVNDSALVDVATELRTWSQGVVDVRGGGRVAVGDVHPAHVVPGSVRIGPGGTLAGNGTIKGRVVLAGGTLSPGHSVGELRIEGDLEVLPGSTLDIEVGGPASDQIDRVVGVNSASLAGTLRIRFASGFTPGPFLNVPVLDAASIAGGFESIELPPESPALRLRFSDDGVSLVACYADVDGDGNLTPDDLSDYIACYFDPNPCAVADVNVDGSVDPDDLSDYIGLYFSGC